MTAWDRIQRMDVELRQQRANADALSDQIHAYREQIRVLTGERDQARRWAVALEQECARNVCAICAGVVVAVEVIGDAT